MRDGGSDQAKSLESTEVFLLFGSNVGDRYQNVELAIRELERLGIRWVGISSYYETEPTDLEDQPWFVNAVGKGRTEHSPHALLRLCKTVEKAAGRDFSAPRFTPRTLDIDILLFGDRVVETEDLVIPHPRMVQRRFVLIPLLEIDSEVVDPRTGRRYSDVLSGLDEEKKVTKSKTRGFLSR